MLKLIDTGSLYEMGPQVKIDKAPYGPYHFGKCAVLQ